MTEQENVLVDVTEPEPKVEVVEEQEPVHMLLGQKERERIARLLSMAARQQSRAESFPSSDGRHHHAAAEAASIRWALRRLAQLDPIVRDYVEARGTILREKDEV